MDRKRWSAEQAAAHLDKPARVLCSLGKAGRAPRLQKTGYLASEIRAYRKACELGEVLAWERLPHDRYRLTVGPGIAAAVNELRVRDAARKAERAEKVAKQKAAEKADALLRRWALRGLPSDAKLTRGQMRTLPLYRIDGAPSMRARAAFTGQWGYDATLAQQIKSLQRAAAAYMNGGAR